jgi:hypothetical protein
MCTSQSLTFRAGVEQLDAHALGEALDGVLGAAVCGLQRDAAEGQRRPDLDDRPAVARLHPLERRPGAVHETQVGHHRDALVLVGLQVVEEGDRAGEGVVDPQLDRPECVLDRIRCPLHRLVAGDIGGEGETAASSGFDLTHGLVEPVLPAGDDGDVPAPFGQFPDRRASDAGGASGDDGDTPTVAAVGCHAHFSCVRCRLFSAYAGRAERPGPRAMLPGRTRRARMR